VLRQEKAMRAIVVGHHGVELRDIPQPLPGPNDVRVRVKAVGLNRAELGVAAGGSHGPQGGVGTLMGSEWAGEIESCGAAVTRFAPCDRVMGRGKGSYAEYVTADEGRVIPIAADMPFEQAATLPIALETMYNAVVTHGQIQPGQTVLVTGASAGVGLVAMQVAKLKGAIRVIGTSTNAERRAQLANFGADIALDTNNADWVDAVLAATEGKGADLVIDQVSGTLTNQTLRATKILGRIINVGRLGGDVAPFDFDLHAMRRIAYIGVSFRSRSLDEMREITRDAHGDLSEAVANGKIRLPIDRTFPLEEAAAALAHMAANKHFGKIVLTV
jgi:NADPH2:quinone reductase